MKRFVVAGMVTLASCGSLGGGVQGALIRGTEPVGAAAVDLGAGSMGDPAEKALADMEGSYKNVADLYKKADDLCSVEIAKTEEWQKQEQDMGFAARQESRAKLASALAGRIGGLKKFLKRLKKMRSKLYEHIERVNKIFTTKYNENLNNVHMASDVLKELGMIQTEPWNPHVNPIKNFAALMEDTTPTPPQEEEEAAAAGSEEGSEAGAEAPASFIQLVEKAYMNAKGECKAASNAAFNVYELGLRLNEKMDAGFEEERKVLAKFRDTLGGMIQKREAKLEALTTQLEKVQAALQAANQPFQELKEGLAVHLASMTKACASQKEEMPEVRSKIKNVVQLISSNHVAATGGAGDATGAAEQ